MQYMYILSKRSKKKKTLNLSYNNQSIQLHLYVYIPADPNSKTASAKKRYLFFGDFHIRYEYEVPKM